MFEPQDNAAGTQPGPDPAPQQDDTLNGVTELVGGVAKPGPGDAGYAQPAPQVASDEPEGLPPIGQMIPTEPAQTDSPAPSEPADQPATDAPADDPTPAPDEDMTAFKPSATPADSPASSDAADDSLLDLKQQALQQLTPLVGQLEQTPEEKFRTTMMLIQAADNKDLLKDAYEAAQAIDDEKVRARALLDVINEINYFTQKPGE